MTRGAPTAKQLLILADRAERGLTPAEADRLRAGIRALDTGRRSVAASAGLAAADYRRTRQQLAAIARVMQRARYRGARHVAVWALDQALNPQDEQETA